tara:strand:+ start:624 stop:1244 length:621 start_codon:yes stop_codon:yes gene_type:complete
VADFEQMNNLKKIMRLSLFIFLHIIAILILLIVNPHARAEDDEWNVHDFGNYVVASVAGEVIWGDKLRFALQKTNCNKVQILFTFSTTKAFNKINELKGKTIPIQINDIPTTAAAEILLIRPALKFLNVVMMTAPGLKDLDEFSGAIMSIYNYQKSFRLRILNENNFNPENYFDITENNWKLDEYPKNINKAHKMCIGKAKGIIKS